MQLRTLIGPRAGEILDFCPQAAYAMLADGRAEMPSDEIQRPPIAGAAPRPEPATDAPVPVPAAPVAAADVSRVDASAKRESKQSLRRRKGARR